MRLKRYAGGHVGNFTPWNRTRPQRRRQAAASEANLDSGGEVAEAARSRTGSMSLQETHQIGHGACPMASRAR